VLNKLLSILLVAVVAFLVSGCIPPTPTAPPAYLVKDTTIYANPNNPFTQPIPQNPTLHANSVQYVDHLVAVLDRISWWNHDWSKPIFYASSADAKRDIWYGDDMRLFHGQRFPTCTTGQIAGEGSVSVVNQVEGCVQHYWGFNVGIWTNYPHAFSAGAQPKDFDGTFGAQAGMPSRRGGGTASGLVGNRVWPDELTSVIPRGQFFVLPKDHNLPGNAVAPAIAGDGIGTCQYDLPQGARIQLNPSYDLSSLYMYERVYGQALKTYGAYLGDSSAPGATHMSMSGPPSKASAVNNIFAGCFPDNPALETATDIGLNYNIGQFRVLPFGAPVTVPYVEDYSTYCGTYNSSPAVIPAPTLTSISPSSAPAGSTITLNGTNLSTAYRIAFGNADAFNPTIVSASQIRCVVPDGVGTVAVFVRTGGGQTGTQNFTYSGGGTPPALSAINPASGSTAGGTACTLTGSYLTGCTGVSFGGTAASGISVVSASQVRCTSPAKSAGTVSVNASTVYGTSNGVNYTYTAPPGGSTATLYAAADCAVYQKSPNTNKNGSRCNLQSNTTGTDTYFYARFDMTGLSASSISSAKFRWNHWGANAGYTIKAYSCPTDSWLETTITWNNKPAIGTQQASVTLDASVGYTDWDVTTYIQSVFADDKVATLVMRDDLFQNKNIQFYDKEAGASTQPQLVVVSQ